MLGVRNFVITLFVTATLATDIFDSPNCQECVNGKCDSQGNCLCHDCWSGIDCTLREAPEFTRSEYDVEFDPNTDRLLTVAKVKPKPSCGNVSYFLSEENDHQLFRIDEHSGDVTYIYSQTYSVPRFLVVSARYRHSAVTSVKIHLHLKDVVDDDFIEEILDGRIPFEQENDDASYEPNSKHGIKKRSTHSVSRRAITGNGLPTEISSSLERTGSFSTTTNVKVADIVPMKLVIWMPNLETKLKVELFGAVSNDTSRTIMAIVDDVTVSIPNTNFATYKTSQIPHIEYSSYHKDGQYDMAVVDFGTIENEANNAADKTESEIVITFNIIILYSKNFINGDPLYITATAGYGSTSITVWIADEVLVPVVDSLESGKEPVLSLTGANTAMVGTPAMWTLNMTLEDAANNITVDVFAPVNATGVMSVCSISIKSLGGSYKHYNEETIKISYLDDNAEAVSAQFGYLVNTGFRTGGTTAEDNTIQLVIVAMVQDNVIVSNDTHYQFGVSVVIDTLELWSSQMSLTIAEKNLPPLVTNPVFDFITAVDGISRGTYTAFYLNISAPEQAAQTYRAVVAMPYNSSAIMVVESMKITHVGYNYKCFDSTSVKPVFSSEAGVGGRYDYVTLDLGVVFNSGVRSDADSNFITIQVIAKLMENATVTPGDAIYTTAAVYYDEDMLFVAQNRILVVEAQNTSKDPTFEIKNMMLTNFFYEDSSFLIHLDIEIPLQHQYSTFTADIYSATDNSSTEVYTQLCRVAIVKQGRNILVPKVSTTNSSTLTIPSEKYNDRIQLNLSGVSNLGLNYNKKSDNMFTIEIVVSTAGHSLAMHNNTDFSTFVSVLYTNKKIYAAEYLMTYNDLMSNIDDWSDLVDQPQVSVSACDLVAVPGQAVMYTIDAIVPPTTTATWDFLAVAESQDLSVCRVEMVSQGNNISPCLSEKAIAEYTSLENDGQNDLASLKYTGLTNIGLDKLNDTNKLENTFRARIVIGINPQTNITANPRLKASLSIEAGSNMVMATGFAITLNSSLEIAAQTAVPTMKFYHANESSIVKGAAGVYVLEIYSVPTTYGVYKIKALAPANGTDHGKLKIHDIRVMSTGFNCPCVNDTLYSRKYIDSQTENGTMHDMAEMEFRIANVGTNVSDVDNKDNLLTMEIVVGAPDDSTANIGDYLFVAVSVQLNDEKIFDDSMGEVLTDVIKNPASTTVNVYTANNDSSCGVGQVTSYFIDITLSEGTDRMRLTFDLSPYANGPSLILEEIVYATVGSNIAADPVFLSENYTTFGDEMNGGQTSSRVGGVVDVGLLTNTGTTRRYKFQPHKKADDIIKLQMTVMCDDNPFHFSDTTIPWTLTVTGSNSTSTTSWEVNIKATGNEKSDIYKRSWLEINGRARKEIGPQDEMRVCTHFNHTKASTAHVFNVVLHVLLPVHSRYEPSTLEYNGIEPIVEDQSGTRGVLLKYDHVRFSDNLTVCFNFTIDPIHAIPVGSLNVNEVVTTYLTYYEVDRNQSTEVVGEGATIARRTLPEDLSLEYFVADCFDEFGVRSGQLQSCQVLASTSINPETLLSDLSLDSSTTAWKTSVRHLPYFQNDYIQIYSRNATRLTGIGLKGDPETGSTITKFRLKYSMDGLQWFDVKIENSSEEYKVFAIAFGPHNESGYETLYNITGNSTIPYNETKITSYPVNIEDGYFYPLLSSAFVSHYVRFIPLENSKGDFVMSARLEMYGCVVKPEQTLPDECPTTGLSPPPSFQSTRCFMATEVGNGEIFACVLPNVESSSPSCSKSEDLGSSWIPIDEIVGLITFYNNATGNLYGVNRNNDGYLLSSDLGDEWVMVSDEVYTQSEADAYTTCVDFPLNTKETDIYALFNNYVVHLPRLQVSVGVNWNGIFVVNSNSTYANTTAPVVMWDEL